MKKTLLILIAGLCCGPLAGAKNHASATVRHKGRATSTQGFCYMAPNCQGTALAQLVSFPECEQKAVNYVDDTDMGSDAAAARFRASWTSAKQVAVLCEKPEIDTLEFSIQELNKIDRRNEQLRRDNPNACPPNCTYEYYDGVNPACVCAPVSCNFLNNYCQH
jgi:hypothetical protein